MYKKVTAQFQGRELCLETGKVAKQASGAVMVTYGDTVILVTAVADKTPNQPGDFVPLTVNYQEKFFATGKVPGGFFKREARPTDFETLVCRIIDRTIRPLFPKSWCHETQIIPTVFSTDLETGAAPLALLGASAALEVSHIPFEGPVAAVQVGRIDGEWIINPPYSKLEECDVDLMVAGNRKGITMVEGGAAFATEDELLEGLFFGYESLLPLLDLQEKLRQEAGVPKAEIEPIVAPDELFQKIGDMARADVEQAWRIPGKMDRHDRLREIWRTAMEKLEEGETDLGPNNVYFSQVKDKIDTEVLRGMIIGDGVRADGRKPDKVRQVDCEVGVLPRTHGSALFTRGETQGLAVTTLGTRKDERKIERLEDEYYKTFFLHYNFPPYCVGETKFRLGPGRREIGHGHLAERALARVLPSHEDFPYTIRVVSEITESPGEGGGGRRGHGPYQGR
jgi:polyribonucleotide nucleotidyltransferase